MRYIRGGRGMMVECHFASNPFFTNKVGAQAQGGGGEGEGGGQQVKGLRALGSPITHQQVRGHGGEHVVTLAVHPPPPTYTHTHETRTRGVILGTVVLTPPHINSPSPPWCCSHRPPPRTHTQVLTPCAFPPPFSPPPGAEAWYLR